MVIMKTLVRVIETIELTDFSNPSESFVKCFHEPVDVPCKYKCSLRQRDAKKYISNGNKLNKEKRNSLNPYWFNEDFSNDVYEGFNSKNSNNAEAYKRSHSYSVGYGSLPRSHTDKSKKPPKRSCSFQEGKVVRVCLKSLPEVSHLGNNNFRSQLEGRLGIQEEESKQELSIDRNSDPNLEAKVKETTKELNEEKRRSARRKE